MKRDDSYLVIYAHRLVNRMDHLTSDVCRAHGLTLSQFGVLEALYSKGSLPVGKVKDLVLSSDGTIPLIVRNLEKAGYVSTEKDPGDARRKILNLTEEGRAVVKPVIAENDKALAGELSDWSSDEKAQLIRVLRKHSVGS
ncbi:MAG: MarR family winged helix-turn-helix transcriptional regulator [Coriobacteriales bacterium]